MYPIEQILSEVYDKYKENQAIIVSSPTATGKSTILPLDILKRIGSEGGKIIMLEPRRLAAKTIAIRMADLLGEKIGETIGYSIRFESVKSEKTRLEVVTEGILTRMIQSDNELAGISTIIFDEFHERNLNAELALALCRECQKILRPDLKIIIMSATIDTPTLSEMLSAPVITCQTKMFDVETIYEGNADETTIAESAVAAIRRASKQYDGDMLVFLPGEGEIHKCEEALKNLDQNLFAVHPLYGMLPPARQTAAILPDRTGKRKIVLATSIAETSLTIEGVKIVIDSGFGRVQKFNPNTGLSRLETVRISQDMADQRKGRAGRLSEGVCIRLYSKAVFMQMDECRRPEIEYADLAPLTLELAKWGETDPKNLLWLTPPPNYSIAQAKETLLQLEALDESGKITPQGIEIQKIPCHPRIAKMLIEGKKLKLLPLAADIAAILDFRDPMPDAGTDINLRIETLRRNRAQNRHSRAFDNIANSAAQYVKMFSARTDNSEVDPYDTGLLLAYAFPERIASAKPGNNAQFMLSNGAMAMADHNDTLAHEPWISIASLNARDGMGKIFLASPLSPESLKPMLRQHDTITWNTKKGGIVAVSQLRIGNIVLREQKLKDVPSQTIERLIIEAIKKEGENILNFDTAAEQLQNRILSLRIWNPEQEWPDVSTATLTATADKWLTPYLNGITTVEQLKKLDLTEILKYSLNYQQQSDLDRLAPTAIQVPSGSHIKIKYHPDGAQPILAVRLQEVFGLAETPKINNNRTPVLMHLLSPGYKPVQITSDLKSFWNSAYYEVKKELKSRYPKHVWPDDPWNEQAVRGVKRKG